MRTANSSAIRELKRRQLARRSLTDFTRYVYPAYRYSGHLLALDRHLEAVEAGRIRRLMIFMPPRHGKSLKASVLFPAWYLGRDPTRRVILTGYSLELAQSFSRRVRNLIASRPYQAVFGRLSALERPVLISGDSRAAHRWDLAGYGGGLLAAGVRGGITGHGADLIVIDDPVKSRAEAESPTLRARTLDWYRADLYTRLEPDGAIVLIMTRWHQFDLAGTLLAESGDEWTVLKLPALAGEDDPLGRLPGEPLWADRFGRAELERIRRELGSYDFAALYQQEPRPPEGQIFRREWFNVIEKAPAGTQWVRFWDLAASRADYADFTVGVKLGLTREGRYLVGDVVRGRWMWPDARSVIIQTARSDGPGVRIGVETVAWQVTAVQELMRDPALTRFSFYGARPDADKLTRALPFAARAEAGLVDLVAGGWNSAYLEELCAFPQAQHDDQVDATSGAYRMLTGGFRFEVVG